MSCGVDIVSGVPVGGGADPNAIHVNVNAEISGIALKAVPIAGDYLVIEDSVAGDAKKRITVASLPGGADPNAIHVNVNAEISGIALKAVPIVGDFLVIEDSVAADAKKRITIGTLPFVASGAAAGGDLGGTYPDPTVDDGADSTAIHDNVAAEISAIANKAVPIGADYLIIEDSVSGDAKKHITIDDMPFLLKAGVFNDNKLLRYDAATPGVQSSIADLDDLARLQFIKTYTFQEHDNGNSGAAKTIDWNNNQKQLLTLTANTTLTFTAPLGEGSFTLRIIMGGAGGYSITWPATVKHPGTAADWTALTTSAYSIASIYWDGTNYNVQVPKDATDDVIPFA